jgi:magnesium chelatase family protein
MLSRVFSCAVIGLNGVVVEVEVDTTNGLPRMDILESKIPYSLAYGWLR